MDSIYFDDPLGLLIELAAYRFEPPFGSTHGEVLLEAHKIRVERGDHHIALSVSQATFREIVERLDERGIRHSGPKDRGFMDSIYFDDPLGLLIELAAYRFEPPFGYTHADVLLEAHHLRVERGDHHIDVGHLADAIERLVERSRGSLSDDRTPKNPYSRARPEIR